MTKTAICDAPCSGGGSSAARKGSSADLGHMWHCNRKVQTAGDRCYQHGNHRAATEAAAFNEKWPIGTPVEFWPGAREVTDYQWRTIQLEGRQSTTRTLAWVLGGTAVVSVDGYGGGIALTHVEPIV